MDVVRHDHKFVEKKFLFVAIVRESFDQKGCGCVFLEDGESLSGDGRDEECAIGVHAAIVVGSKGIVGEGCHNLRGEFQNGTQGLKARPYPGHLTRPLKGRSSTETQSALFATKTPEDEPWISGASAPR